MLLVSISHAVRSQFIILCANLQLIEIMRESRSSTYTTVRTCTHREYTIPACNTYVDRVVFDVEFRVAQLHYMTYKAYRDIGSATDTNTNLVERKFVCAVDRNP